MTVSLVIPAYNEEKYITKCLESIIKQEEKADEIIVVDNNCTDKTVDIAKKFPVKIVKEKTQGIIAARRRGFDSAAGDIIARCDADVIVPPDWIKKIKRDFSEAKIDALSGPISFYDYYFKTPFFSRLFALFMKVVLGGCDILLGPNLAITQKIWQEVKEKLCADDTSVHEDIDLAIRIHKNHGKIFFDNTLIVKASARRIKLNPFSFFIEYPWRLIKTLSTNN